MAGGKSWIDYGLGEFLYSTQYSESAAQNKGKHWPPLEVSANVNKDELKNLSLTAQEESDIVAFLKTLSDRYKPKN